MTEPTLLTLRRRIAMFPHFDVTPTLRMRRIEPPPPPASRPSMRSRTVTAMWGASVVTGAIGGILVAFLH